MFGDIGGVHLTVVVINRTEMRLPRMRMRMKINDGQVPVICQLVSQPLEFTAWPRIPGGLDLHVSSFSEDHLLAQENIFSQM